MAGGGLAEPQSDATTPKTPQGDSGYLGRIRRHDSTEAVTGPSALAATGPQLSPASGARVLAARAVQGGSPQKPPPPPADFIGRITRRDSTEALARERPRGKSLEEAAARLFAARAVGDRRSPPRARPPPAVRQSDVAAASAALARMEAELARKPPVAAAGKGDRGSGVPSWGTVGYGASKETLRNTTGASSSPEESPGRRGARSPLRRDERVVARADAAAAAALGAATAGAAGSAWAPWAVLVLGLLVRHACSLHPYSGEATPPRFGDYEAHRHWMEVTLHLPLADWYRETPDNELEYWGLDYPPLMAYVERGLGLLSRAYEPASVALSSSRGFEAPGHRAFMRATALVVDALVFASAAWALARRLEATPNRRAALLAVALLAPALVLVDHGHFQYNSLPLGLTLWAAWAAAGDRPLLSAACFSLALNCKQTALYYAPAVFFDLLGRACRGRSARGALLNVAALGATVLATFGLVWGPLLAAGGPGAALDALKRCFPTHRGLFEDKVANAWYAAQVVLRARDRLGQGALLKLAALATLLASFGPTGLRCRNVVRGKAPTLRGQLRALHLSALAFFLCSYHVHEKGIIVPLAPLVFLALDEPLYVAGFSLVAAFTMLPLLAFEGLALAYAALQLLFALAAAAALGDDRVVLVLALLAPLHVLPYVFPAPARYPDLYPALTALAGAGAFGLAYLYAAARGCERVRKEL